MKFKYIYPITTSLVLNEQWPICLGDLTFEWMTEAGLATAIYITIPANNAHDLPKLVLDADSKKISGIHFGDQPHFEKVDEVLHTLQGLLNLFTSITIHFDRYEAKWIPETLEESEQLKIFSYSKKTTRPNLNEPRRLTFDLVARVLSSLEKASDFEIPLNFLRKGNLEIHADRYIEAFYNLFFFLETLYAPGFSDPKKVKKKLKEAAAVMKALKATRQALTQEDSSDTASQEMKNLLCLNDDALIDHLVDTRGDLHHHALRRPGVWHPNRPKEFLGEAFILQRITHEISMARAMEIIFSPESDMLLLSNARSSGAIQKIRIDATINLGEKELTITPLIYSIPGRRVTREIINKINSDIHQNRYIKIEGHTPTALKFMSEDGTKIYAEYKLT
jgi:hypothetical protein